MHTNSRRWVKRRTVPTSQNIIIIFKIQKATLAVTLLQSQNVQKIKRVEDISKYYPPHIVKIEVWKMQVFQTDSWEMLVSRMGMNR